MDLDSLAAIREGSADCKDRLEERLVEMLDAASENPGFGWSVTGGDEAALIKPCFNSRIGHNFKHVTSGSRRL